MGNSVWVELGKDYGDTESEKAEQATQRAVNLAPNNAAYLLDLAERQSDNGYSADAERSYRHALALSPQSADALSRLGGFLLTGHPTPASTQEAERLLRRALALQPDNDYAVFSLGQLELERNHPQQAIGYLKRVVRMSPDVAYAWYGLSRAYERAGDRVRAARAVANSQTLHHDFVDGVHTEELLRLHPGDMALHRKLARLCAKKGEVARAILVYQLCLKVNPGDSAAYRELDRLMAFLKANGRVPSMNLFNILVSDMAKRPE